MKNFIASCCLAFCMLFGSVAHAKTEIGAVLSMPEIFGVYLSYYPVDPIALDTWLTLSTVDFGPTFFLPFAEIGGTHSLVLTGLVGYSHNLVPALPYKSFHSIIAAGYAWQSVGGWDFRIQAGTTLAKLPDRMLAGFHGHLQVGHTF